MCAWPSLFDSVLPHKIMQNLDLLLTKEVSVTLRQWWAASCPLLVFLQANSGNPSLVSLTLQPKHVAETARLCFLVKLDLKPPFSYICISVLMMVSFTRKVSF